MTKNKQTNTQTKKYKKMIKSETKIHERPQKQMYLQ